MNNKNNNGFLRNAFLYIIVIIAVVTEYNTLQEEAKAQVNNCLTHSWLRKLKMVR